MTDMSKNTSSSNAVDINSSNPQFITWEVGENYTVERVLGKGSYGQVALALDKTTGNKVAIKRMTNIFDHSIDAKRAYREMHILRHLRHPNIIHLKDVISPIISGRVACSGEIMYTYIFI
jgi:serine/threonine protein kinase